MAIQKRAGGSPAAAKSDEMLAAAAVISSPAVKRTVHKLMDGDLQLFQKPTRCFWQCAATVVWLLWGISQQAEISPLISGAISNIFEACFPR
jgi:hypothetical protein